MTHLHTAPAPVSAIPALRRIAIQGVRGAFHDIAARRYFGDEIDIVPAPSFDLLVQAVLDGSAPDGALMAIENTIAGSILFNYNLLQRHDLHIAGEVSLRIRQNLMALPGVGLDDLREVHSHPVALAQCAAFFERRPHIRLLESADTALSAERIRLENLRDTGAIGSELAAQLYGLDILAPGIESYRANYTRFLVLERGEMRPAPDADKASVSLSITHEPGSLAALLQALAATGADLSKIQSIPLPDHPWEYRFLIDFTQKSTDQLLETLQALRAGARDLKVFGLYKSGRVFES